MILLGQQVVIFWKLVIWHGVKGDHDRMEIWNVFCS